MMGYVAFWRSKNLSLRVPIAMISQLWLHMRIMGVVTHFENLDAQVIPQISWIKSLGGETQPISI